MFFFQSIEFNQILKQKSESITKTDAGIFRD